MKGALADGAARLIRPILACAVALSCSHCASRAGKKTDLHKAADSHMKTNFEQALQSFGAEYVRLELDMSRAPLDPGDAAWLKEQQGSRDPAASLLATVVLNRAGPRRDDYKQALDYLEQLPAKFVGTVMRKPSGVGVEGYLTLHFEGRLAELLALRLIKEPEWPHWEVVAAILYLQTHKVPATTGALIRFAIEAPSDQQRKLAIDAIHAIGDPELPAKLMYELARAKSLSRRVPEEVRGLGG